MKFIQTLHLLLAIPVVVQTTALCQISRNVNNPVDAPAVPAQVAVLSGAGAPSPLISVAVDKADSLIAKRTFFSTRISQQGARLTPRSVIQVLKDSPKPQQLYRWSQLLKPIGPLLAASGLVIGYIGIKGTTKTGYVRGIRTLTNPNVPDVPVNYTSRSLPVVVGGVGLFIGGLCLIELSNELTAKSIHLYNANVVPRRLTSRIDRIMLGITTNGSVGVEAHF